jgi:predicted dehydrogenase
MNDAVVKVGVIGTGHLGQVHARIYAEMDSFELVGISDVNLEQAGQVASANSCRVYEDPTMLMAKVDAVSIAVPTSVHADVALPFLAAGVPVLLEKPVAASVEEAEALVAMAAENSTPFLVGHLERFNPALGELKARLESPVFIDVQRLSPFSQRATDVDVVTDLMIHDLDIVSSLLGETDAKISATGSRIVTDKTDVANVRAEYPSGVVASFTASRVSQSSVRRMRVYQESGYLELDYNAQTLLVAAHLTATEGERFGRIEFLNISPEQVQPLQAELAHFHDVITNGYTPVVSGVEGLAALRQVEAINHKIRTGQTG